jgi:hypothetical protein
MEILREDGSPLPENHHLDYRPDKGDFRMKVTVNDSDPRMVGKRIFIPLHTKDIATARMMRDGIIRALSKAGVLSRRVQLESDDEAEGDNSDSRPLGDSQ